VAKVYVCRNWWPEMLAKLSESHQTEIWMAETYPPREVLLDKLADVEGLLCPGTLTVDKEILDAAPQLRVVSNVAVGYSNLDIKTLNARRIPVGYTPTVLTETTADLAFALILASARRIIEADSYVKQRKWLNVGQTDLFGVDVNNTTLGIVGLGRIGSQVAKRAKAFNMRVLYYDVVRREDLEQLLGVEYVADLHELLAAADFVSIHTDLSEKTRHMIGAKEFAVMKPTAIFINIARGPVVDQNAMYEALKSKKILHAALDVVAVEPIPPDDPLLSLDNVIITPHVGSAVLRTRKRMLEVGIENLLAGLRGERLPYCANPTVYET